MTPLSLRLPLCSLLYLGLTALMPVLASAVPLTVELREQARYRCHGGAVVSASYYSLNDDSLAFVRLSLPGGNQQTLPNVVSGSGARYSDDASMVWWVKGDGAFAQTRGSDGSWQSSLEDCRLIKP
jgi:membrane-bound inhibitor of C-type lysozyme